jgi:hypothetical protein
VKQSKKNRPAIWAVIIGISVLLFILGHAAAVHERGCAAVGGEYLLLAVPTILYICGRAVRGAVKEIKRLIAAAPEI